MSRKGVNPLARRELDAVRWDRLWVICGEPTSAVPAAVEQLLEAQSDAEAEAAYWKLDNHVVVQGQLFDSAVPLVSVLFAAVAGGVSSVALQYVADLIVEIVSGESDVSEVARGHPSLGDAARERARGGLWLVYGLALTGKSGVKERALYIADVVDPDRARVRWLLTAASSDPDPGVREHAKELLAQNSGGEEPA